MVYTIHQGFSGLFFLEWFSSPVGDELSCHTWQATYWSCLRLQVGREAWLYLWVLQSCFIVYFWHTGLDRYLGYCSHLMLIRVHYSVQNHVARSALEEANLKMRNKSVLKTYCVIIQHTCWEKSEVYDISHGTTGQNYVRQTTVSRGKAMVEKSISSASFYRLFSQYIFPQISMNVCKKCLFSLFL